MKDDLAKIKLQKSQFLLLPEGYPEFYRSDSISAQIGQESVYTDHLLEVSDNFSGVVLGGSLYKQEGSQIFKSSPILQNTTLIDFYQKKNISSEEKQKGISPGVSESIFIMGGIRYGILLGEDASELSLWEHFVSQKIEIVFHLTSEITTRSYEEDLNYYASLSKTYNLHVVRVCGISKVAKGRSLYASPTGINWKTGKMEEESEVLKTLSVNISGSIFQ